MLKSGVTSLRDRFGNCDQFQLLKSKMTYININKEFKYGLDGIHVHGVHYQGYLGGEVGSPAEALPDS
jgi:hypothetical protein